MWLMAPHEITYLYLTSKNKWMFFNKIPSKWGFAHQKQLRQEENSIGNIGQLGLSYQVASGQQCLPYEFNALYLP